MEITKYTRLRTDCQTALAANNLEKCFELLAESLDERMAAYSNYVLLRSRLSAALNSWNAGLVSHADHSQTLNLIRAGILGFLNELKPEEVSLLRRIHDTILIVACKNSPTDWENLFPEAFFSHARVIRYRDEVPSDFRASDIVIFDDLGCAGDQNSRQNFMRHLANELPKANLLYFGKENPFQDSDFEGDSTVFNRMANANSRFTVHARLRELLEYRKVYSPSSPASANS